VIALLPLLLCLLAAPERTPPDLDEVMKKQDDLFRSKSSVARMEIAVTSARGNRTLRMKSFTRGDDHALIVIEAPPREAGIATLRVGENLWNWLPRIARTIRVPPSMMLGSWMGTDLTNDDLVRESSYRRDFASRVDGWSDSPAGWRIVAEVKPGAVGRWAKIEMVIADGDWLPLEMRYFDRRGRLARTMTFAEPKLLGGRRIPTRMTLVPVGAAQGAAQKTEMRYLEVQFDAEVPDETFSLSRLEEQR
jgi:outer membrane lipoprotein-sorting protein